MIVYESAPFVRTVIDGAFWWTSVDGLKICNNTLLQIFQMENEVSFWFQVSDTPTANSIMVTPSGILNCKLSGDTFNDMSVILATSFEPLIKRFRGDSVWVQLFNMHNVPIPYRKYQDNVFPITIQFTNCTMLKQIHSFSELPVGIPFTIVQTVCAKPEEFQIGERIRVIKSLRVPYDLSYQDEVFQVMAINYPYATLKPTVRATGRLDLYAFNLSEWQWTRVS